MRDIPPRSIGRRLRNTCRVLHGTGAAAAGYCSGSIDLSARRSRSGNAQGSALVEILISLSLIAIGVVGLLSGNRAIRTQAELASRRAAEALAAQQVLEQWYIWAPHDSTSVDTVAIGVRIVEVSTQLSELRPGLVRVQVSADAGAGAAPLRLKTVRRAGD